MVVIETNSELGYGGAPVLRMGHVCAGRLPNQKVNVNKGARNSGNVIV